MLWRPLLGGRILLVLGARRTGIWRVVRLLVRGSCGLCGMLLWESTIARGWRGSVGCLWSGVRGAILQKIRQLLDYQRQS